MMKYTYLVSFSGISLSIGVIILIGGLVAYYFPPKKINWWYGHRTPSTMKSEEAWRIGNRYSNKISFIISSLLILSGVIGFFFESLRTGYLWLGIVLTVICLVMQMLLVKNKLRDL